MEAFHVEDLIRMTVTEFRRQQNAAEAPGATREWTCPICRNIFADDGTRVCTEDQFGKCACPDMPDWLRAARDVKLIRRAEGRPDPEVLAAMEREISRMDFRVRTLELAEERRGHQR